MAIKRRNKIRLPNGPTGELEGDISVNRPIQQVNSGVLDNLEDDDSDICELQPIKFKKVPKRDVTFDGEQLTKENNSHYRNLYSSKEDVNTSKVSKDDVVVLNMEDMMEGGHRSLGELSEGGDSFEEEHTINIPTPEEIVKLKAQKSISRRNFNKSDTVREKDYVKLLDKEDKRELMETIKSNGGLKHTNEKDIENFSDDEMQDYQDERLALTDNQVAIQKDSKRRIIEEAIGDVCYRVNEEWEAQLLSKGNVLKPNEKTITALPILYPKNDVNGNNIEAISEMVSKISFQRKKVEMRLQALQKAKIDLEETKVRLLDTLIDN
ncbi:YKR022C [Saccharomyces arboricola H-6]|uniref:YKR022C n=1 Tax=Saccharomyces arboricola (strain H-6 / AS 2.3317 / CBS 10644) TaxID=1160507 RepID=J8LLI1_SACAR|nr:YKR022C [Saccharomyces arboricola H-6]